MYMKLWYHPRYAVMEVRHYCLLTGHNYFTETDEPLINIPWHELQEWILLGEL